MIHKISVISVLYFSKDLVSGLIENIKTNIGDNLHEIILVDNSNEGLNPDDNYVKVHNPSKNLGYGAALNYGVSYATGDYILIINPDSRITTFNYNINKTEHNIITGVRDETYYFYGYPRLWVDTLKYITSKTFGMGHKLVLKLWKKIQLKNLETKIDWAPGDFMFMSKSTYLKVDGFDENYFLFYEEVDFCKRALQLDINCYANKAIKYYSLPQKSSSIDVSNIKIVSEIQSFKRYFKMYNNKFEVTISIFSLKLFFFIGFLASYPLTFNSRFEKMNAILKLRYNSI